jgi:hypothetical protein
LPRIKNDSYHRAGIGMIKTKTFPTYIYSGYHEGYDIPEGYVRLPYLRDQVTNLLKKYCDTHKIGMVREEVDFFYPGGHEYGFKVTLNQHPEFIKTHLEFEKLARHLAKTFIRELYQERVFIVNPDYVTIIEKSDVDTLVQIFGDLEIDEETKKGIENIKSL